MQNKIPIQRFLSIKNRHNLHIANINKKKNIKQEYLTFHNFKL